MRDYAFITQDPAVERWFRFKADRTKKEYTQVMRRLLDFTGPGLGIKDPSGLVSWAKSRADNLEVQDLIEKFGEGESTTGRLISMSIVRSLLKRNGVGLPSMGGQRQILKNFHRAYSRQELQSLIGYLDQPLQKLYVLFAKDSGLRAQDLLSLCYRHVKKDLEEGKESVHLYLEPGYYNRRKASGLTFLGPNSVKMLRQLIEAGQIKKDPTARIFPMSYQAIAESIRIARKKAGVDPLIQPNHGLRKFFENCLDRVGMDHHKKLQLEGHSLGVRMHYTDRDLEDLRTLYGQAYQYLDLSEEGAAETRVKELERIVGEQRQHIEALKADLSKQKELEADVALLKRELPQVRELLKLWEKKLAEE